MMSLSWVSVSIFYVFKIRQKSATWLISQIKSLIPKLIIIPKNDILKSLFKEKKFMARTFLPLKPDEYKILEKSHVYLSCSNTFNKISMAWVPTSSRNFWN